MVKLKLGEREVCTSILSQRAFRAAPCELLLDVTRANRTASLAALKRSGELDTYSGLRVTDLRDLSFLSDFPLLLYLEILSDKPMDTRPLDGLSNLRGLRLQTPGAGLDFSKFPELEVFIGDWHPDNCKVAECRELRQLCIWHFKPCDGNLSELASIVRLEKLKLIQTSIASLDGLETLDDLRYLEIGYAPQLKSLNAFAAGKCGIRELSLSKAKGIQSYEPITAIEKLRRLKLTSCSSMPNLKWMQPLKELDFFTFVDTDVADGDLSPLLNLPKLRSVGTLDKRHYNYKCDVLTALLNENLK